jgi:hypothetical protein
MGFIPSGQTVYAQAYLTEKGRQYIFGNSPKPRFATKPDGTKVDSAIFNARDLGQDIEFVITIQEDGSFRVSIHPDHENYFNLSLYPNKETLKEEWIKDVLDYIDECGEEYDEFTHPQTRKEVYLVNG